MAYAVNPNDQQNQNQASGQQAQAPVPTSAATGAGPTGAKTPTGSPSPTQSAQPFTNLQSYLTANAPQIQQQANTISGNLTNQYGQVMNDIGAGTQAFNQQVAQGYTPENQGLVQQAAANPASFVQTPGNVQAFQSQINDQYTGPSNFEGTSGYSGLNNEVTQDIANAQLVGTPSGLQTYLQGNEKNYTPGESMLDTSLLGSSPGAIQQVQAAAAPFSQLPTYLSNQVTTADQAANAAPTAAQQASSDAQTAINNSLNSWEQGLSGTAAQDLAAQQAYDQQVANNSGPLGNIQSYLSAYEGGSGINVPYTVPTYQQISPNASPSTVAGQNDIAEQAAFNQLMGTNPNFINPSLAGSSSSIPTQPLQTPQQVAQSAGNLVYSTAGQIPISQGGLEGTSKPNPSSPWEQFLASLYQYDPYNQKTNTGIQQFSGANGPIPGIYNFYSSPSENGLLPGDFEKV